MESPPCVPIKPNGSLCLPWDQHQKANLTSTKVLGETSCESFAYTMQCLCRVVAWCFVCKGLHTCLTLGTLLLTLLKGDFLASSKKSVDKGVFLFYEPFIAEDI